MIGKHLDGWEGVTLVGWTICLLKMWATCLPFELRPGREDSRGPAERDRSEDKPLKYPTLFNSADAAVITKIDIASLRL